MVGGDRTEGVSLAKCDSNAQKQKQNQRGGTCESRGERNTWTKDCPQGVSFVSFQRKATSTINIHLSFPGHRGPAKVGRTSARDIEFSSAQLPAHTQHDFHSTIISAAMSNLSDTSRLKATVFVGGLDQAVTQQTLFHAFLPFGDIVEVNLPKPELPNTNEQHRGFGYVEFETAADALDAIDNMDRSELYGSVVKVAAAKPQKNANEGLGSKTAIWEQVRLVLLLYNNACADIVKGGLVGQTCCERGRSTGYRARATRIKWTHGSYARPSRTR